MPAAPSSRATPICATVPSTVFRYAPIPAQTRPPPTVATAVRMRSRKSGKLSV